MFFLCRLMEVFSMPIILIDRRQVLTYTWLAGMSTENLNALVYSVFHSRGQHLCKFIGTKESVCIRKEFNSRRISLGNQHGRRFIVLGHQYGRRDVMWKHSIKK